MSSSSRFFLTSIATLFVLCLFSPAELRKWTDQKSGRQISGKIIDKKTDHTAVFLELDTGKQIWIETKRLIEADRQWVAKWEKPFEFLKVVYEKDDQEKIIGLKVVISAKDEELGFIALPKSTGGNSISFIAHTIAAGESMEVELDLDKTYSITLNEPQSGKSIVKQVIEKTR